jgi:glucosylglycerate phosphorylase
VTTGAALRFLYGRERGRETARRLARLLRRYRRRLAAARPRGTAGDARQPFTEKDALLIVYADHLRCPDRAPLACLGDFLERRAAVFSMVHLLPFFPSSSDEGFSVMDHRAVDPALGGWSDVRRLARRFRLMADLVLNHASVKGRWFSGFLGGRGKYRDFFLAAEDGPGWKQVFRPRAHPLFTVFHAPGGRGERSVWTTFSPDQADLDYRNPRVLLEMVDVMLGLVARGVGVVRLDAVGYIWKERGTACLHRPRAHAVVRLLRTVVEQACPWVSLVTETNVPHADNVSYLGNGADEAHAVYNFTLPPLLMECFRTGDASALRAWAPGAAPPRRGGTFINFLSSHDGIGLVPARGALSGGQVEALVALCSARGGEVSVRDDGSPYELNIAWLEAISDPTEPVETRLRKYVTSHCIMMSLAGVPAVWFNSLLGAPSDTAAAVRTGSRRSITRRRWTREEAEGALGTGGGLPARIHGELVRCLSVRAGRPAFHPRGAQEVLPSGGPLFALLRVSPDGADAVVCVHNAGPREILLGLDTGLLPPGLRAGLVDLLGGGRFSAGSVRVGPWASLWLVEEGAAA